ncbi:MAG: hypothetical protein JOS17DRAFT_757691 [Linnemannia elongata]|nr:MAG: hypothetical protein JOS17DRAFT_757691 [Linnemannia elongata]
MLMIKEKKNKPRRQYGRETLQRAIQQKKEDNASHRISHQHQQSLFPHAAILMIPLLFSCSFLFFLFFPFFFLLFTVLLLLLPSFPLFRSAQPAGRKREKKREKKGDKTQKSNSAFLAHPQSHFFFFSWLRCTLFVLLCLHLPMFLFALSFVVDRKKNGDKLNADNEY